MQWLSNADHGHHRPKSRLLRFFNTLYSSLVHGARAVFQFYPENASQEELITSTAMQAGFTGGLVIDYPNSTKRKKYFLCLFAGQRTAEDGGEQKLPQGLTDEGDLTVRVGGGNGDQKKTRASRGRSARKPVKDRNWVLKKKELRRRRGEQVPLDSKFTGRKRKPKF